jgi:hypothetical protein
VSSARPVTRKSTVTVLLAMGIVLVLAACGGGGKSYDIGPIFPLSTGKCAKYGGDQNGSGVTESCMVTKDECERAAADWREAMRSGGVNDTIEFSCS